MNTVLRQFKFESNQVMEIVHGDLLDEPGDAIVNAANAYLQHGGGVAGAILARGGAEIQSESDRWVKEHGLVTHDAPAVTKAGRLPYRHIIHAVGPIWGDGEEDEKLARTIKGCLVTAENMGLTSLSMPPISTGIFGYPKARAALVFFDTIRAFFLDHSATPLTAVRVVIIDPEGAEVFTHAFDQWQRSTGT